MNQKNGFLLIRMTPDYVNTLLEEKGGQIVGAYLNHSLVGYIILTDISEFLELYHEESYGYIETTMDLNSLEKKFEELRFGYIEQIAVGLEHTRSGIGKQLMNACKQMRPDGLVADVFIFPIANTASLEFFQRVGFVKFGVLHQYPRVNFPYAHRTQTFLWN